MGQNRITTCRVCNFKWPLLQLFFHGAMEVPDISKQRYTFFESDYTTVELVALEIIANKDVKA